LVIGNHPPTFAPFPNECATITLDSVELLSTYRDLQADVITVRARIREPLSKPSRHSPQRAVPLAGRISVSIDPRTPHKEIRHLQVLDTSLTL
jgi:hypothetical protein